MIAVAGLFGLVGIGLAFFYRTDQAPKQTPPKIAENIPIHAPKKEVVIQPSAPVQSSGRAKREESITELPATTPVVVPQPEQRAIEENTTSDFASRGARLLQARKLSRVGLQYLKQGKYQKAAWVLSDSVRTFPGETRDATYGEALFYLGYSLRMSGKPEAAIPILKRAMNFPYYRTKAARELQTVTAQMLKK